VGLSFSALMASAKVVSFVSNWAGKRIEERSDRLAFQHSLAYGQTPPKITGAASDGSYEQLAKRL